MVIKEFENGDEIRIEEGDSGTWLLFDGDCENMLPYCRAHCCTLSGTFADEESQDRLIAAYGEKDAAKLVDFFQHDDFVSMKRGADGYCIANDKDSRLCNIYEHRPNTCQKFHCSRGSWMRGWPLGNLVKRQNVP